MPEQVERAVLGKDVEPVGPDDDSGQHHTHDMGYAQLAHYYGCEENDAQHDEEYQRRGCYGENCDISGINIRYVANLYAKVQKKSYFCSDWAKSCTFVPNN